MTISPLFIIFCESKEKSVSPIPLFIVSFENRIEVYNCCSIDGNRALVLFETLVDEKFTLWGDLV
jgi:hypothetical protein